MDITHSSEEITLDILTDILGTTIVADKANKALVFLTMLSAYEDPLNACLLGPSGTGKTFIVLQVSQFFPEEDVVVLSGATSKSLLYDYDGTDDDGVNYRDFRNKIYIFTDMPNSRVLESIRSILSHDRDVAMYMSTAGGSNSNRKTQKIRYYGYPSVIFCSANMRINPQEATRCILLSPDSNPAKIRKATRMAVLKASNPEKYNATLERHAGRQMLRARVQAIRNLENRTVVIKDMEQDIIARYSSLADDSNPANSRTVRCIISLIKALALLNYGNRIDAETGYIVANESDIDAAFKLWEQVSMYQGAGLVPAVMNFFESCFMPAYAFYEVSHPDGITIDEVIAFCAKQGIPLPSNGSRFDLQHDFFRLMLERNLVTAMKDPTYKHHMLYLPAEGLTWPHKLYLGDDSDEDKEDMMS